MESNNDYRPIAIDLFCGVGGLSLGFEQAGFEVAGAFDIDPLNVATHLRNFPKTLTAERDLSTTRGADLLGSMGLAKGSVDIVFGGPPCQGFSVGGKHDMDDERNLLLLSFARLVCQIRPRYFVLENVAGLLQEEAAALVAAFRRRVTRAGYRLVEPILVLNAADFGVPQRRRRAFVLGHLADLPPLHYPHPGDIDATLDVDCTVRDAIGDLPDVDALATSLVSDEYYGPLGRPSRYAARLRATRVDGDDRAAPRHRRPGVISGCLRTAHEISIVRRFRETLPGEVDAISRYFRLAWEGVAPTLRAGTGYDHGRHTAPRPIHPSKHRCITTREAARIHSFPDWFAFHPTRWNSFRQIGNSVPPQLARAVACSAMDTIRALKSGAL